MSDCCLPQFWLEKPLPQTPLPSLAQCVSTSISALMLPWWHVASAVVDCHLQFFLQHRAGRVEWQLKEYLLRFFFLSLSCHLGGLAGCYVNISGMLGTVPCLQGISPPFFFNLWRGNDKIYVCSEFLENYKLSVSMALILTNTFFNFIFF